MNVVHPVNTWRWMTDRAAISSEQRAAVRSLEEHRGRILVQTNVPNDEIFLFLDAVPSGRNGEMVTLFFLTQKGTVDSMPVLCDVCLSFVSTKQLGEPGERYSWRFL